MKFSARAGLVVATLIAASYCAVAVTNQFAAAEEPDEGDRSAMAPPPRPTGVGSAPDAITPNHNGAFGVS